MDRIIIAQILTRFTKLPEAKDTPCEKTIEYNGVTWYCTREKGHEQDRNARAHTHAAHYDDDHGESVVGVAWEKNES